MPQKLMKKHPLLKIMNSALIDLPTPSSISFNWNFGSLLGITLMMQIITGILLTFHYTPNSELAFSTIAFMTRDIPNMWLIRWMHANGASMFFLMIYLHIGRNIYYSTHKNHETWMTGLMILFILMATAFLGYVLPWGQMSFWGATVITNLVSAIPYIGLDIVQWLWGGFAISNETLKRFFSLHFLFPFLILAMMIIHLLFLHQKGSTNPLGLNKNIDKIPFHPYFTTKDLVSATISISILMTLIMINPLLLNDPENFNQASPLVTPIHIQPEWYFLFAYAILRSIPNKLGGVIALLMSILIFIIPPMMPSTKFSSFQFYPMNKILFWIFIMIFCILTWIGANPVEDPFIQIGMTFSVLYFLIFTFMYTLKTLADFSIQHFISSK